MFVCHGSIAFRVSVAEEDQFRSPFRKAFLEQRNVGRDALAKAALRIPVDKEDAFPSEILEPNNRAVQVRHLKRRRRRSDRKPARPLVCSARPHGTRLELLNPEKDSPLLTQQVVDGPPDSHKCCA